MPLVSEYKCSVCDFSLPTGWGGYMYVTDKDGERIVCSHPSESRIIEAVLKASNPETVPEFEVYWTLTYGIRKKWDIAKSKFLKQDHPLDLGAMIKQRTGFNSYCVCRGCLYRFEIDLIHDKRECPECKGSPISSVRELVGKGCPRCGEGKIIEHLIGIS